MKRTQDTKRRVGLIARKWVAIFVWERIALSNQISRTLELSASILNIARVILNSFQKRANSIPSHLSISIFLINTPFFVLANLGHANWCCFCHDFTKKSNLKVPENNHNLMFGCNSAAEETLDSTLENWLLTWLSVLVLTIWYFRPFGDAGLQSPRDLPSP